MWKWMDMSICMWLMFLVVVFVVMIVVVGFVGIMIGWVINEDLCVVYLEDVKGLDLLVKDIINLLWVCIYLINFDVVLLFEELKKLLFDVYMMVNIVNDVWVQFMKLLIVDVDCV